MAMAALETPGNSGALGAPWLIERDNDAGITVVDDRGYVVWNENWSDLASDALTASVDRTARMIGECRERAYAVVGAVNSSGDLIAALKNLTALVHDWRRTGKTPDLDALSIACDRGRAAIAMADKRP